MFTPLVRSVAAGALTVLLSSSAQAQLFNRGCNCGPSPMMAAPVSYAPTAYNSYAYGGYDPCNTCAPAVAYNPCVQPVATLQPVTQTVQREVPVTKYRPVEKTVQKPVYRTVMEQRQVTRYRTVNEARTVDVPSMAYQTVTECRQQCVDRGQWQTSYQRVPKVSPCQYDPNPTMLGWMNRNAYAMRMAMTPNFVRQRSYVPNTVAYSVPVSRVVAVPTSRQVTYNVARLEPYMDTQTVAVQKLEYEPTTVTTYEPYTDTQTVSVNVTTYAYVDPYGASPSTTTALTPTPENRSRSAAAPTPANGSAPAAGATPTDDLFKPLSYPRNEAAPTYYDARHQKTSPTPANTPAVANNDGWRASRSATPTSVIAARPVAEQTDDVEVIVAARK